MTNKLKIVNYLVLFGFLLLLNSCNDNSTLEVIEESKIPALNDTLQKTQDCGLTLFVTYDFNPFMDDEEKEAIKANYANEMSEHFTICSVTQSIRRGCDNVDKWIVNGDEYYDYINNGQTAGTGDGNKEGDGGVGEIDPGNTHPCF